VSLSVGHPLLDAIIKLTAQRDQETLADALVDAILTLTNTDSASVYALGGELGHLLYRRSQYNHCGDKKRTPDDPSRTGTRQRGGVNDS